MQDTKNLDPGSMDQKEIEITIFISLRGALFRTAPPLLFKNVLAITEKYECHLQDNTDPARRLALDRIQ